MGPRVPDDRIDREGRDLCGDIGFAKRWRIVGLAIHRRLDAAAPVMAYNHYVPDFEHLHGKLQRGCETAVVLNRQIGDVAMNKHFAGIGIDNLGCRNPTVGTAYPEISWSLLIDETAEERGIAAGLGFRPGAVAGKQVALAAVRLSGSRRLRGFVQGR